MTLPPAVTALTNLPTEASERYQTSPLKRNKKGTFYILLVSLWWQWIYNLKKIIKSTYLQQDLFSMTMVTIMLDTKSSESESFIDGWIEGIINILVEFHHFYRTRVRSLGMLVSDWLTNSLLFSNLDWCDPDVWRCQLKTCWGCYCCWCWCLEKCWQWLGADLEAEVWL